jgi:hypothetical protein
MSDAELHLDGNAAAGLLAEIFTFDVTSAQVICAGCGAEGPVASLAAYGLTMGAILRCPSCDTALMRITHLKDRYHLDLRGTTVLTATTTAP